MPGELSTRWMDAFGDHLYNVYGSTEVSAATIATPEDLRHAPGTAGRPARGTVVRLYDEAGRPVLQGDTGRIFVGNALLFEGYTGGGSKDRLDGLMATGDVGHFDPAGRLFVDGRDDDMIVSGGENVFPQEVEEALMSPPRRRRRRRRRGARRRSSASGCGPSWCRPAARGSSRRSCATTSGRGWRASRPRATS